MSRDRGLRSAGRRRGQSHVVGVAVLLAVTTLSLAALTASIGAVVETNAAGVNAGRVAGGFESALAPTAVTGSHAGRVSYTGGVLHTADRTVRLLDDGGVVATVEANALVYEAGEHRVASLAGAVVRGRPGNAVVAAEPPVATSTSTVVIGVATLGDEYVHVAGGNRATLRTRVTHERRDLGMGAWRLGVETATPGAWERYFRERGAVTTSRDFDGDGVESVVARFPGRKRGYLVVHRLHLEVEFGGA